MNKLGFAILSLAATVGLAAAANNPPLLSLVTPDAKVIAGAQVDQSKGSAFGQYVLAQMQTEDAGFAKFIAQTGFDPRRDVTELLVSTNGDYQAGHGLVLAHGDFNSARILGAAQSAGALITRFQGYEIVSSKDATDSAVKGVAVLDATTAALGDLDSIKSAITRYKAGATTDPNLAAKMTAAKKTNDFWFVTLVPISNFAGKMPDANLSGAMQNSALFQSIVQASGGIKFGNTVTISAEAVTRSDKDATALTDVVRFLAGLISTNKDKDPTAANVATLLDNMQLSTNANVMTMSLQIPERQLEQMIEAGKSQQKKAAKTRTTARLN